MAGKLSKLFDQITEEICRQDHKFGQQDYVASWYNKARISEKLGRARAVIEQRMGTEKLTWHNILREEIYEALAETDLKKQNEELIQCAAVILQWILSNERKIGGTNGDI